MELPLLQVSLFASLVILVSGASLSSRSIPEAGLVRTGGGGGGGGGMGGFGGGFGGGGGGSSSGSDDSSGGQMREADEECEEKGMRSGCEGGWGGGSREESSEGQTDHEGSGDEDGAGQGDGNDADGGQDGSSSGCNNDDTGNYDDDDYEGNNDDNGDGEGGNDDNDDEGNDEEEGDVIGSSGSCSGDGGAGGGGNDGGDGQGWGEGCCTKSTNSDNKKRSIKSIKSPDMGQSSIPSSFWLSSVKTTPRSYYWEYYNDNNLVSGGSDGGTIHRPHQDISNVVTVIPYWVLTQFMRGLTFKMAPLGPILRAYVTKHGITESHPLLRFKRETNMMKSLVEEYGESGAAANDAENEAMDESEEMESAEEIPSEAEINSEVMGEDISSASENVAQESPSEEGGLHQGEFVEEMEFEEGGEIYDEMNEIQREVMEKELEIAQEAMNPAMLDTLMLDPTATDSFLAQARAVRSMERNGAEVVEDLTLALKSDMKSAGTPRSPVDRVVREPRNTRILGLDLGKLLELELNVGR